MKYLSNFFLPLLLAISVFANTAIAQEEAVVDNSLQGQFNQIKEQSESYKKYKVIDRVKLDNFWKNIQDTLSSRKTEISQNLTEIGGLEGKINTLNQTITQQEESLEASTFEKEHINVLGADFTKSGFISFSFIIILTLAVVLAFFVYKFQESNKVTVRKKNEYAKLDGDFEKFKKEALDKQMKLRRELQTEKNKLEELYQKVGSLK